jgi:hypothetical protein
MYQDDNKNAEFKLLHIFTRIQNCKKWANMCTALFKGGVYNSMAPVPGATEGRPKLGQKAKSAKLMGPPTKRLPWRSA